MKHSLYNTRHKVLIGDSRELDKTTHQIQRRRGDESQARNSRRAALTEFWRTAAVYIRKSRMRCKRLDLSRNSSSGLGCLVLLVLVLVLVQCVEESTAGARHKRFVAFRKGSTFFYRLNYKVNVLPYTTIFAQASGFKVAWELPTGNKRIGRSSLSFDDIQDGGELVYQSHGFNGKMCLLKSLCQAMEYIKEKDGILMKILHLLSGSYSRNYDDGVGRYNNVTSLLDPLVCRNYANHCPLHLISFDAFAEH